jgi:HD-like signal output (HDOD) protein
MELKSILYQPGKMPTIPKVTQELILSFSREDVSIGEIARQLATDPALTAKLLRLANSAYFHVSRTIGTVDDALRMLGFVMVRNLVLGSGMATAFGNAPGMNLKQFWLYNLYTACGARWLATTAGVNADLVFTAGLLHGIGQLQMHAVLPGEMASLDKQCHVLDAGRAELEKRTLGFHYGEVAGELARIWHFPAPIVQALCDVPLPLASTEFSETAAWVHIAAWWARTEILSQDEDQSLASYPEQVGARLGLDPNWVPAIAARNHVAATSLIVPALREMTEGLDAMLA